MALGLFSLRGFALEPLELLVPAPLLHLHLAFESSLLGLGADPRALLFLEGLLECASRLRLKGWKLRALPQPLLAKRSIRRHPRILGIDGVDDLQLLQRVAKGASLNQRLDLIPMRPGLLRGIG